MRFAIFAAFALFAALPSANAWIGRSGGCQCNPPAYYPTQPEAEYRRPVPRPMPDRGRGQGQGQMPDQRQNPGQQAPR